MSKKLSKKRSVLERVAMWPAAAMFWIVVSILVWLCEMLVFALALGIIAGILAAIGIPYARWLFPGVWPESLQIFGMALVAVSAMVFASFITKEKFLD